MELPPGNQIPRLEIEESILALANNGNPEEALEIKELYKWYGLIHNRLSLREKEMFEQIENKYLQEDTTWKKVAAEMNLSYGRISQLRKAVREKANKITITEYGVPKYLLFERLLKLSETNPDAARAIVAQKYGPI